MLANVIAIAAIFAVIMAAQFTQTVAYMQGANARNAGRVADVALNAVESDFIVKANAGTTPASGTITVLCLNRDGTNTTPAVGAAGTTSSGGCTYTATTSIVAAGDSTSGISASCATQNITNCTPEVSQNVNDSIGETRSAYAMDVKILNPSGSVAAEKRRTITIRSITNAATNGQYVTIVNTAEDSDLLGGGRKGVSTSEGDIAGCDPTATQCGDRTTIQSWSQCNQDSAMVGGKLNAAQTAWCAANAKNTTFNNHAQTAPITNYNNTTTLVNKPWTNSSTR